MNIRTILLCGFVTTALCGCGPRDSLGPASSSPATGESSACGGSAGGFRVPPAVRFTLPNATWLRASDVRTVGEGQLGATLIRLSEVRVLPDGPRAASRDLNIYPGSAEQLPQPAPSDLLVQAKRSSVRMIALVNPDDSLTFPTECGGGLQKTLASAARATGLSQVEAVLDLATDPKGVVGTQLLAAQAAMNSPQTFTDKAPGRRQIDRTDPTVPKELLAKLRTSTCF